MKKLLALMMVLAMILSTAMAEDLVFWANGHFFRGLYRLIRDFFKNKSQTRRFKRLLSKLDQ